MMLLLAVSDVVWQAMIGAVVTVALAWIQWKTKAAVEKAAASGVRIPAPSGQSGRAGEGRCNGLSLRV